MTIYVNGLDFQTAMRSRPVNDDMNTLASGINDLQSQFDMLLTPASGAETVNARDYHGVLRDRIRSGSKASANVIITGFEVTETGTPDMYVNIADGEAIIDGIGIDKTSISPILITAPTLAHQLAAVVVNSDNTISIEYGTEHATNYLMPSVASTQRVISLLILSSSTTSLNEGAEILDARDQGCYYRLNGKLEYTFKIQDAINDLPSGGDVEIGNGNYYETLVYDDSQTLTFHGNAILKDATGTTVNLSEVDLSAKTNTILKWNDGVNRSGQEASNIYDLVIPIGAIFQTHPNLKSSFSPDVVAPNNFVKCDSEHAYGGGTATALSSTYFNNTGATAEGYVPDLTDDRFTKGGSSYARSGSNTINIEHTHTGDGSAGSLHARISQNGSDDTIYSQEIPSDSWNSGIAGGTPTGEFDVSAGVVTMNQGAAVYGATTESLSTSQNIMPKYFNTDFYMRKQ